MLDEAENASVQRGESGYVATLLLYYLLLYI